MTELRLSAVTSHVAMQTNVKIRKLPKIPKPVRLARSHIAHAVHWTTEHPHAENGDNPSSSFGGDTSNYMQTLTEIICRYAKFQEVSMKTEGCETKNSTRRRWRTTWVRLKDPPWGSKKTSEIPILCQILFVFAMATEPQISQKVLFAGVTVTYVTKLLTQPFFYIMHFADVKVFYLVE